MMDRASGAASTSRSHNQHSSHSHSHQRQQQKRPQDRSVDLVCRVKYGNTLPDLPFEPKFLHSPFISLSRFINYKPSSLEKNFKYELLTEPDLNVKIDLIDPMTYYYDPVEKQPLDPIDEQLLEDESLSHLNTRRSIQHRKVVPWMRKTEYISTEFNRYGIGQTGAERPDTKIGYGTKKRIKEEPFEYKDRDSQIAAIQKTFSEVQTPAKKHYSKPGVTAVEEMPIFPDFELWKFPFAQVIFDADPLPYTKKEHREQKLTEAILKGMADSEGNQFVGYFAPISEALEQLIIDNREEIGSYKEGMEYHYKLEREFNWSVQSKMSKGYEQENYFLVHREGTFYYNELDTKVKLTRRPKSISTAKETILSVTFRKMTNKEEITMTNRANQLFGIQEEEIEEEEDAHEEEEGEGAEETKEELTPKSDDNKADGEEEKDGEKSEDDNDEEESNDESQNEKRVEPEEARNDDDVEQVSKEESSNESEEESSEDDED